MPGSTKRPWFGKVEEYDAENPYHGPVAGTFDIAATLPDNQPGRKIVIHVTKEQAREWGTALWLWGQE